MSSDLELSILKNLREEVQDQARRQSENNKKKKSLQNQSNELKQLEDKPKPLNIFARNDSDNLEKPKFNLFSNNQKSINLFNISNQVPAQNIFNKAAQNKVLISPSKQSEQESENNIQEAQNVDNDQEQFKTEPKVKEMKYQYIPTTQTIKEFHIRKFRSGTYPAKEQINLALVKSKDQIGVLYLIAKSRQTHICLYQSLVMKTISKVQDFMGKQQNVKIDVIKVQKDKDSSKNKLNKDTIKIQFETVEDCKQFRKIITDFLGTSQK